jgi:hypothetical protein
LHAIAIYGMRLRKRRWFIGPPCRGGRVLYAAPASGMHAVLGPVSALIPYPSRPSEAALSSSRAARPRLASANRGRPRDGECWNVSI